MFSAILVLLPLVYASDIMRVNWDTFPSAFEEMPYHTHDRMDEEQNFVKVNSKDDHLESEFGVFVDKRPNFQTQKNYVYRKKIPQKFNYVQTVPEVPEVPKLDTENVNGSKKRINLILKNYLNKLYDQKFTNKGLKKNTEGKFFDESLYTIKNKTKNFSNKFLSLFQIVKFPNAPCQASSALGDYLGTCYHATECAAMNGTNGGACADGYGVCCIFRYSCGANSNHNCTYFESPGYPDYDPPGSMVLPPSFSTAPPMTTQPPIVPDPRDPDVPSHRYYYKVRRWSRQAPTDTSMSCTIDIYKLSDNIQQMRIDFIDLELTGPTNGTCVNERLVIAGQNVNDQVPVICGYNTGQHVYVDVSTLDGPLRLSVLSATGERKRFKIRVCQIADACTNQQNCLQQYTGVTGMISSFNYDQAAMANRSTPGYFNNLNYAICIRKEAGYCSITYTNTIAGLEYPFQLVNVDDDGESTVPQGQAGVEIFNCPNDYIVIDGIRLCGDKFNDGSLIEDFTMNAPVTDTSAGPIVIPVRSDGSVTGRGFKLFYTQNKCPNT